MNWSFKASPLDDDSCACCFPRVGVSENRILDSVAVELDNDGELRLEYTIYDLGDQGGDEDALSGLDGIGWPNESLWFRGRKPDQRHRLEIYRSRGLCAYPVFRAEDRVSATLWPLCRWSNQCNLFKNGERIFGNVI